MDYQGGRTDLDIVNWIKKRTGPSVVVLDSLEAVKKLVESNEVVVLLFGDSLTGETYQAFEKVSKNVDDVTFGYCELSDARDFYRADTNSVILLKKFDEGRNDCNCEVNEENLKNFIDRNQYPTIMPFNEKAAEKIFGEGLNTLFLFLSNRGETNAQALNALTDSSSVLKGKIVLSVSKFEEELGQRLGEYVGVTEDETPLIKIISPVGDSGEIKKYNYEGDITSEGLIKFYEAFAENKLKPHYKSEPVPEKNDEPVKVSLKKSYFLNKNILDYCCKNF